MAGDNAQGEAFAAALDARIAPLPACQRIAALREALPGRIVFTTSLGLEDQVIAHMLSAHRLDVALATLDTGRLFPETYALWAETEARLGVRIEPYFPQAGAVEAFVRAGGINSFYASLEARKACCGLRKIEPLERALAGAQGWIAGLRADQSEHRHAQAFVAFDATRGLLKLNPIFDWTREDAVRYAAEHDVPLSPLHAQGFLSIGCAPCTRAVAAGEPERAGRWWWEQDDKKECGLHVAPDGRLVRAPAPAATAQGPFHA